MASRDRVERYRRGLYAEYLAAAYLWVKGYDILARRYKTPVGEVDLVARKGDVLAFVEVKGRADLDTGASAVTAASRGRIERAALLFLAQGNADGLSPRFDIIAISPPFFIRHIDNAWQPRT